VEVSAQFQASTSLPIGKDLLVRNIKKIVEDACENIYLIRGKGVSPSTAANGGMAISCLGFRTLFWKHGFKRLSFSDSAERVKFSVTAKCINMQYNYHNSGYYPLFWRRLGNWNLSPFPNGT
jgi:hypothetical protein